MREKTVLNEKVPVNEWLKKIKYVTLGRNDVYSDYKKLKYWVRLKCSLSCTLKFLESSRKAQVVNVISLITFKFPHYSAFFLHNQQIFLHNTPKNSRIIFNFFRILSNALDIALIFNRDFIPSTIKYEYCFSFSVL